MSCHCNPFDVPYKDRQVKTFKIKNKNTGEYRDMTGRTYTFSLYDLAGKLIQTVSGNTNTDSSPHTFTIDIDAAFWNKLKKGYQYEVRIVEQVSDTAETIIINPFNVL